MSKQADPPVIYNDMVSTFCTNGKQISTMVKMPPKQKAPPVIPIKDQLNMFPNFPMFSKISVNFVSDSAVDQIGDIKRPHVMTQHPPLDKITNSTNKRKRKPSGFYNKKRRLEWFYF